MILTVSHLTTARRMLVFTIFEPPNAAPDRLERAERLAFIKDGFTFGAFLLGPLWLAANGLWQALIGYIVGVGGLVAGLDALGVSDTWIGLVLLAIQLGLGFEADALQRWSLMRRGWQLVGTVSGTSRLDCERRFFDAWLASQPILAQPTPGGETQTTSRGATTRQGLWLLGRRT